MNDGETTVRQIVRSVVDTKAHYELGYFERLERFDDPWVVWHLRHARHRDEPLGIGIGEVAPLVTPVIWIAVYEAAREVGHTTGGGISGAVRSLFLWLLRRKPRPSTIPPLTEEQREMVRDVVRKELGKKKLSETRIDAIADAVYHALPVKPLMPGGEGSAPFPGRD
jgi:hypothetical protein